jgi:hypothetical protein
MTNYFRKRRIMPLPNPRAAKVNNAISPPPLLVLPLLVEPFVLLVVLLLVSPLAEPDVDPLLLGLPMLPLLLEPEVEPVLPL